MERPAIYCQNCGKVNSLRDTHCRECGTRLLIVVFPNSLQYDTNQVPSFYEDHLLERVTFLELRLAQVLEKLQMTYELFSHETEEFKKDHVLMQSFLKALDEFDPQFSELFKQKQAQLLNKNKKRIETVERKKQLFDEILAEHKNPNADLFKHILNHGIKLLADDEKQAFQMLERAALLSPANVSLHIFIAEKLFKADKFDEAKKNLERIFQHSPTNPKILLLLGTIYADEGEAEKARRLLSLLANGETTAKIVDFIWGMLAIQEQNWTESIAAFKEAQGNDEIPELDYLIGCAFYQLNNSQTALSFLKKAVQKDPNFPDCWFMKALIHRRSGDPVAESSAIENAKTYINAGGQSLEFLKGKRQPEFEFALPFIQFQREEKRVLMNKSLRLANFFRRMLFDILEN